MNELQWVKAKGVLRINKKEGKVFLQVHRDFVEYYKWFIQREYKIDFDTPRHGAHISLVLPKYHGEAKLARAKPWEGDEISFEYCLDLREGAPRIKVDGKEKRARNFWMKVRSAELDRIKTAIGVKDNQQYQGLHLTIGNDKGGARKYQPKTIEIR